MWKCGNAPESSFRTESAVGGRSEKSNRIFSDFIETIQTDSDLFRSNKWYGISHYVRLRRTPFEM